MLTGAACLFCKRRSRDTVRPYICRSCLSRLPFRRQSNRVSFQSLALTLPDHVNREVICPFYYTGAIRENLLIMKFGGSWHPSRALGPLMAEAVLRRGICADIIVPVPLHKKRLQSRGFNQAERLAAMLGRTMSRPVRADLLVRTLETPPQSEAPDLASRFRQVLSAFELSGEADGTGTVLLVDDVLTTGATLYAAARVLAALNRPVQAVVCASNQGKPVIPDR